MTLCAIASTEIRPGAWEYRCRVCGYSLLYARADKSLRWSCPVVIGDGEPTLEPAQQPCRNLASTSTRIPAGLLSCRCGSIALHPCGLYRESVTETPIRAQARSELIRLDGLGVSGREPYWGRTCQGCPGRETS